MEGNIKGDLNMTHVAYIPTSKSNLFSLTRMGNIVNTSGKAGAQILHLPLGDDSSPSGDALHGCV
jgi:hypothetical protein